MEQRVKVGDSIRIDDDMWSHRGTFFVHGVEIREHSTATKLILEDESGSMFTITVANHQIEKL